MKNWILFLALMLIATDCLAEKYRFEESALNDAATRTAICLDMMANLKELGEPPMVCDRKFSPKFKQFSWPAWTKLDHWENRDLIYQIEDENFNQSFNKTKPYWQKYKRRHEEGKKYLKSDIDQGDITLATTRLKIDGKLTDVLMFIKDKISWPCKEHRNTLFQNGRQYYFVDMKNRKVDFVETQKSMLFGLEGEIKEYYGDMFLYKGVPYTALWYGDNKEGTLVIKGGVDDDYCAFEYNKRDETKGKRR
jgi:hypothetical protein